MIAALALPGSALAADPGLWVHTGSDPIPYTYLQGMASDARDNLLFAGPDYGLARTTPALKQVRRRDNVIPPDVAQRERYNHIGDPDFDLLEGGRVLLPLECFWLGESDPNTCRTGSIGVAAPSTLAWRYYVKLDPAVVPKAMWVAAGPDGLLWTSAGDDLHGFRAADVNPANAGPGGPAIPAARTIPGAAAGMHVAGAVFHDGRLFLAGLARGIGRDIVRSVNVADGTTRTEIERPPSGEPEGLDVAPVLGGLLHWVTSPGGIGSENTLETFHPAGARMTMRIAPARPRAGRRTRLRVDVRSLGAGMRGAIVKVAGRRARTNRAGRATLTLRFPRAARYRVSAERKGLRRAVTRLRVTSG